jgi:restriction endonuclease
LDGIIRQDALGLDLVGAQAKRYDRDSVVQRPEMQAFVGALQGAQTSRGVFVTTGRFSSGARQFAEQVAMRLVLIDGTELTRLMVRYNVGVSVREVYELKAVDDDFFEDDQSVPRFGPCRPRRARWAETGRRFATALLSAYPLSALDGSRGTRVASS